MSAKAEYQQQRKAYRVKSWYDYLNLRDPVRANMLMNAGYRDHEIPMSKSVPGKSNHISNEHQVKESLVNNLPITINEANAHIIHTFASTNGNLEIIRKACKQAERWSKVDEGYMHNALTNNMVHWIEIKSPKGKVFRVCFDTHPKFQTPTAHVWEHLNGKLHKRNLYSGDAGAARRYLRETFTQAGPNSPWFSLHGAHPIVVIALLLNGVKLNIVSKNPDITLKILCS